MLNLKKIISHLDSQVYQSLEENLIKNKADNFLFLLRSYRENNLKDSQIIETLDISSNSLYVLKSRLNDKIQEHLSGGDIHQDKNEVFRLLHSIPEMCQTKPREVSSTFLQKLEKDLMRYDMHNELLVVYSALKKNHLFSEKYFHYSQLYNKHLAFTVSLEKSEELLGNFNRTLGQYDFSRLPRTLENLLFLKKGINDHFALNPSRQIELIRNIMDIQLQVFCNQKGETKSTEELIQDTYKIVQSLPESSPYRSWSAILDYLFFEHYYRIGQTQKAAQYFEKTNANVQHLLLMSPVCLVSQFLVSRICYAQDQKLIDQIKNEPAEYLSDPEDSYTQIMLGIHHATLLYYQGKYKEASARLNSILNVNSFKDYFHINTEIKLMLSYLY
ncbi:MAG: hypothetical protein JNL60_11070, partial [Bacteroidia bacterium]|nr:hypothetical protein [Bacteroidia bacterium]